MNGDVRAVTIEAYAACPFSIAQEYAVDYLRRAQAGEAEADIRVPIRFLPGFIQRRVAVTFGYREASGRRLLQHRFRLCLRAD